MKKKTFYFIGVLLLICVLIVYAIYGETIMLTIVFGGSLIIFIIAGVFTLAQSESKKLGVKGNKGH